jgi:hypothetical protein
MLAAEVGSLWILLALVGGREVVLDTFPESWECARALREDNLLERGLQIEEPKCWQFLRSTQAPSRDEGEE